MHSVRDLRSFEPQNKQAYVTFASYFCEESVHCAKYLWHAEEVGYGKHTAGVKEVQGEE